jgi:methylmalonyl-CoA mutase N-terminal domain/subunit
MENPMFNQSKLEEMQKTLGQWNKRTLTPSLSNTKERKEKFITTSSEPIERLYTPLNIADMNFNEDIGFPGESRKNLDDAHVCGIWNCRRDQ